MQPGLEQLYDRAFFAQWGTANAPYVATARYMAGVLHGMFRPRRLLDLGCGAGVHAAAFRALGVDVVAVDGVRAPEAFAAPGPVEVRDLTEPIRDLPGPFDLAVSFEVAEHIPEAQADAYLANCTRFADTVVLSCAPPYQGGHHHVNERPKRYWIDRMAAHGFAYDRRRTGIFSETFKRDRPPLMWMCQQVSVYARRGPAADAARPGRSPRESGRAGGPAG